MMEAQSIEQGMPYPSFTSQGKLCPDDEAKANAFSKALAGLKPSPFPIPIILSGCGVWGKVIGIDDNGCKVYEHNTQKWGFVIPEPVTEEAIHKAVHAIYGAMLMDVEAVKAQPVTGCKLYWVENWPISCQMNPDGGAVKVSVRGGAFWLTPEQWSDLQE